MHAIDEQDVEVAALRANRLILVDPRAQLSKWARRYLAEACSMALSLLMTARSPLCFWW